MINAVEKHLKQSKMKLFSPHNNYLNWQPISKKIFATAKSRHILTQY